MNERLGSQYPKTKKKKNCQTSAHLSISFITFTYVINEGGGWITRGICTWWE